MKLSAFLPLMTDGGQQPPEPATPRGGGRFSIAVAIVLFVMTTGGFGIPMGAIFDDFRFGLTLGAAVGAVMAAGVYWFALRNGR